MKRPPTVEVDFEAGISYAVPTATGISAHDLIDELAWGGLPDASEILEGHSGKEAWWQARAADETSIAAAWIETVYEPYLAHLRRFAIYALSGHGIRRKDATKQDISDMVFQLYGEKRTNEQRAAPARAAFLGYMIEQYENVAAVKRLFAEDRRTYDAHYAAFSAEIFVYQKSLEPVWFEEAVRRRIAVERSRDLLSAAVQAFHQRGFLLRQAAENEKARRNQIGSLPIEQLATEVAQILNKGNGKQ